MYSGIGQENQNRIVSLRKANYTSNIIQAQKKVKIYVPILV